LYTALTDGTLHGAGLDVFTNEPPADDNPLFSLGNIIFSPHNAAMSQESLRATSIACVQNALDALDGKLNYNNVINKDVL
jgi:D-3-phosphoglycerate dehydrogenase